MAGLFAYQGMFNNAPLLEFMEEHLSEYSMLYRNIVIQTMNADSGRLQWFNAYNTEFQDWAKAAFSSTCIPLVFPPFNWEGMGTYVDSWHVQNANVISAVQQCRGLGFDDANITADVLLLGTMRDF